MARTASITQSCAAIFGTILGPWSAEAIFPHGSWEHGSVPEEDFLRAAAVLTNSELDFWARYSVRCDTCGTRRAHPVRGVPKTDTARLRDGGCLYGFRQAASATGDEV